MSLRDKLNSKWVKYPVAAVETIALVTGLKALVSLTTDYVTKYSQKHPESKVMQLTAEQLDDMNSGLEGLAYAGGDPPTGEPDYSNFKNADDYNSAGFQALKEKDYETAAEIFSKGARAFPNVPENYGMAASSYLKMNKPQEALKWELESVRVYGDDVSPVSHLRLTRIYIALEQKDKAQEQLELFKSSADKKGKWSTKKINAIYDKLNSQLK